MEVILFLQSFANPILDSFFQLITFMGEDYFIILVTALIFWCIDKQYGYRLAFAYLTSGAINTVLKEIFRLPRPIGREGIRSLRVETAGGYSFPSGHSQSAATLWTSLMLRVRRPWFNYLAIIMMLLVGLSRLYLGVHWSIDVIVGLILGVGWVFLANWLFNYAVKTNPAIFLGYLIPVMIGLFLFPTYTYYKVAGTIIGLIVGYIIESNYINYNVKAKFWQQAVKMIAGLVVILFIKAGVKMLLPLSIWSDLIRYFLIGFWLTAGATFIFKKIIKD